jgi:hypothetical protein
MEGCKPSKKNPFLMVVAGFAGNYHQKNGELGEAGCPLGVSTNPSTA